MGLFDRVMADCPNCGKPVEFQSKAGECYMNVYSVKDAPTEVLTDILNSPEYCRHCEEWCCLFDPNFLPEPPRPEPEMRRVRQPNNPNIHSTQPYLRWWEEPFSIDDILDEPVEG